MTEVPSGGNGRVAITGGSGFIGTNLVGALAAAGYDVSNFDIVPPRHPAQGRFWSPVDVLDCEMLESAVREFSPDALLHLAARTDLGGKSLKDYEVNTRGVENVIRAIAANPSIRRVIFFSSRLVCRIGYQPRSDVDYCPTTIYGASKVAGEQAVRAARLDLEWTIVRPTSIWGPWFETPYSTLFEAIRKGRFVRIAGAKVLKSFGFVGNTAYQLERLLTVPAERASGRTFYLADYQPIEVGEWAETIRLALGAHSIRTAPLKIVRAGALAGDLLKLAGWSNVPITTFRLENLLTPMVHDLEPIKEIAGRLPYSVEDGVSATVEWMLKGSRLLEVA